VQPLEECAIRDKLSTVCDTTSELPARRIPEAYSACIHGNNSASEADTLIVYICYYLSDGLLSSPRGDIMSRTCEMLLLLIRILSSINTLMDGPVGKRCSNTYLAAKSAPYDKAPPDTWCCLMHRGPVAFLMQGSSINTSLL
jgi:hypothetical protein